MKALNLLLGAFFHYKKMILFRSYIIFAAIFFTSFGFGQEHTMGVLDFDPSLSSEGLNLIYPFGQSSVFLIDECGEVINEWSSDSNVTPGASAHLLSDGKLLRCNVLGPVFNDIIKAGGAGEVVEIRSWDNELLWSYEKNDAKERLHHEAIEMPNGNIMMILWENKSPLDAIEAGRDASLITENAIWPDFLREINPLTNEVVWEWHAWDHLIQDRDSTKNNYGLINSHPEKIDINHVFVSGQADWLHGNAVDYNPDLDAVLLSVSHFNEVWIIDHSTTTAEAASSVGGKFNKGGDLIYRWGNPKAYANGDVEDQKLFFQHNTHWIKKEDSSGSPYIGAIALFNNRVPGGFSSGNIFRPLLNEDSTAFIMNEIDHTFLPNDFELTFTHPDDKKLIYSSSVSSFQILPNDNYLIMEGFTGHVYEFSSDNRLVWEYLIPFSNGQIANQGELASSINFRFKRYPRSYVGFQNQDLSPKGYLELNADTTFCASFYNDIKEAYQTKTIKIYPNPSFDQIFIDSPDVQHLRSFEIRDISGKLIFAGSIENSRVIDINMLMSGLYILSIGDYHIKLIKQ